MWPINIAHSIEQYTVYLPDVIENDKQLKRETDSLLFAAEKLKVTDLLLLTNRMDSFQIPENIQTKSFISRLI